MDRAIKIVTVVAITSLTLGAVAISLGVMGAGTSVGGDANIGAGIAVLCGLFVGAFGLALTVVVGALYLRRRNR